MQLCEQEMKRGYVWFFVAGTLAVCLVVFLYKMDHTISKYHEEGRVETAETLNELRTAQFSLGSSQVDQRTQD